MSVGRVASRRAGLGALDHRARGGFWRGGGIHPDGSLVSLQRAGPPVLRLNQESRPPLPEVAVMDAPEDLELLRTDVHRAVHLLVNLWIIAELDEAFAADAVTCFQQWNPWHGSDF
jgi:hypothetical protein